MKNTMHVVRILVSLYLLYLAFDIVRGVTSGAGGTNPVMLLFAALFVGCAIYFLVFSYKGLKQISDEENETEGESETSQPKAAEDDSAPLSISRRKRLTDRPTEGEDENDENDN